MQMNDLNGIRISRFGIGTKRFPTEDSSRVVHLDRTKASEVFEACIDNGVNFVDTSYSNHKGEAEDFIGEFESRTQGGLCVCTGYFEMIDPRYDYVFQKQLKKLKRDCMDFYYVDGVTDRNMEVNVDSGAIDYLFERKEKGEIAQLGFSSELNPENLKGFIERYPWDFVRMRINYYDWFVNDVRSRYEAACEADVPIIAHGALRCGPSGRIKDEALAILKQADPDRSSVDWALRFVKSLDMVKTISVNMHSKDQAIENVAIFNDDAVLDGQEFEVLKKAAEALKVKRPSPATASFADR